MTVLDEVKAERARQDMKWGLNDHIDFDVKAMEADNFGSAMCRVHGIPTAKRAKELCITAEFHGHISWAHILVRKLAEAIGSNTASQLRKELVCVAAVAVAWIEAIDRRREQG